MTLATKTTLALLIVTLAALALTGCPKPREPISGPPADLPGPEPVKLSLWTIWNAEPRKSALNDIVAHFEQQNPDIDIDGDIFGIRLPRSTQRSFPTGRGFLVERGALTLIQIASAD